MADPQKALQALTDEYQSLQSGESVQIPIKILYPSRLIPHPELSNTLIPARQKLDSQHSENTAVQKEFSTLSPASQIYKAIGPVLLKQDQADAKATVNGRIEYIEKEISRIEGQIEGVQKKMEGMRGDVSVFF
jgi:prefoldin beta subunit